jgi:hypothetical protein
MRLGFMHPEQAVGKMLYSWNKYIPIAWVHTPFEFGFLDDEIAALYQKEQTMSWWCWRSRRPVIML